jgi:hypothetical protein
MDNQSIVILALGGSLSVFFLIGWMIWIDARRRQMNSKAATEFRHKLLDKFSSTSEFIGFIKTEEGQSFLKLPIDGRPGPLDRIIRFVQVGVILAFVGGSLMIGALSTPGPPGGGTVIGACLAAAGIGAMIAAGISYRLVKKWGIITVAATPAQVPLVNEAKTSDTSSEAKETSVSETESETVPQAKAI